MTAQLEIQVVFGESGSAATGSVSRRVRWLAIMNLLAAAAWLYITLVPANDWVHRRLFFQTVELLSLTMEPQSSIGPAPTTGAGGRAANAPRANRRPGTTGPPSAPGDGGKSATSKADARTGMQVLPGLVYGWLAMMTAVGLWLVATGLAGLQVRRGRFWLGVVPMPLSLAAAGAIAWYGWREFEWLESLLPPWVKPSILAALIIFAAAAGLLSSRRALRLHRLGGILVILSAWVTVGVVWAAIRWGQMPAEGVTTLLYAKLFGVQSAYGWLMLLASIGAR